MIGWYVEVYNFETHALQYKTIIYKEPIVGDTLFGHRIEAVIPMLFPYNYEVYISKCVTDVYAFPGV